jgi:2-amino-4-hydroxy-6-hydroxymethyldihydropteridine diphosphokinase
MIHFKAYIGLGANLGDAPATLRSAVAALSRIAHTELTGLSSLFRSTPLGPSGQADYLNAVARLATILTPHQLLTALQEIENGHGRIRAERWGPRTLDLDLLLYGSDQIKTPELELPHRELAHRNFVLTPLLQIEPEACHPDGRVLAELPVARDSGGLHELIAGAKWAIDAS